MYFARFACDIYRTTTTANPLLFNIISSLISSATYFIITFSYMYYPLKVNHTVHASMFFSTLMWQKYKMYKMPHDVEKINIHDN